MTAARICLAASILALAPSTASADLLELMATIGMPGVKGRIDHLAADVATHRLFVAALGNDTVEVVDTGRGERQRSITGMGEPQGVLYLPARNHLFIANGSADRVDVVDAATFSQLARIDRLADADNVRLESTSGTVFVGYGKGALHRIDPKSGKSLGDIALPGHPESFQLERAGARAFVNVPSARVVVVVDIARGEAIARWPTTGASANFPMALDEGSRRLFVGARSPATLLVFDIDSGAIVARTPIGKDADDLFFDAGTKRLYVICGEGFVDVLHQESPDRYTTLGRVATSPRARTGLLVPEERRLYVAAPVSDGAPARLLVYRVP